MTESNQTVAVPVSVSKESKARFYEHGKDALGLALAVAERQEARTLRKVERHHQSQARLERNNRDPRDKKKRLEEVKEMIARRRADARKEKARSRKASKGQVRRRHDAPEVSTSAAPRKRVSFA